MTDFIFNPFTSNLDAVNPASSPGGNINDVQINDGAGGFYGDDNFQYNPSTQVVEVGSLISTTTNSSSFLGNLGIGTSSPLRKLSVGGGDLLVNHNGTAADNILIGDTPGSGYPGIWFGANATTPTYSNYSFLYDSTLGTIFNSQSGAQVTFRIANSTKAILDANGLAINNGTAASGSGNGLIVGFGKVGIGTSTPDQKFVLYSADGNDINSTFHNASAGAASYVTNWANSNFAANIFKNNTQEWRFGMFASTNFTIQDSSSRIPFTVESATPSNSIYVKSNGNVGLGSSTPSALLTLAAGATGANKAPLKFTSGSLQTTAEVGAVEYLTDKFYGTITTGAARKEFTLNNAALTSGKIPVATTNGRLTDSTSATLVGAGVPFISATADLTAQSATVSSVVTTTSPNDGNNHQYHVGAYLAITAISAGTVTLSISYTDETGTSRSANMFPMGLTSAGETTPGAFQFPVTLIRVNPNTAITVVATFSGVSVTFDVGGNIQLIN